MNLRHRPMQPGDIRECVDIVANHPVIGPRYGSAIEHLPEAWLRLLQCEAKIAVVVHADEGSRAPICFFGVTAHCAGRFSTRDEDAAAFLDWAGTNQEDHERRISPSNRQTASRGKLARRIESGLLGSCVRPEYEAHGEVQRYMMSGFIQDTSGLSLERSDQLTVLESGSPRLCSQDGRASLGPARGRLHVYIEKDPQRDRQQAPRCGNHAGSGTQKAGDWGGSWVGALFDYHPPMLGFNRSEQRLLSCALPGATDEQLAEMLGISLPAVKKMWVSIYRRVEDRLPELISDPLRSDIPASGRGKEKRRRLLAYLREHPEELRPVL